MKFFLAVVLASLIAASSPAQNTGGGGTVYLRQLERGTAGYVITGQGAGGAPIYTALAGAGLGDFSGPAGATANAIVRFSGVGGKTGKNSTATLADSGAIVTTGDIKSTVSLTVDAGGGSANASLFLVGRNAGTGNQIEVRSNFSGDMLLLPAATRNVLVPGTTAATSTTTGSLQNSGGFGNAGSAYIGGNTFLLGNLTVTGVTTISTSTPVNAVATGNPGYVVWDANFIYICVAANTWKRVAIATW